MNQKTTGILVMGAGIALIALSTVMILTTDRNSPKTAASTTTIADTTSTTTHPVTTSLPPRATTTTAQPTTTTTIGRAALVSTFIEQFSAAISNGESEFVFTRLHPQIVEGFGEDVCRSWVDNQIMALSNYIAAGLPQGPTMGTLETPAGTVEFDNRYTVDVSFTFGGQDFETTADFVVDDTTVYFTGSCQS